MAWTFQGINIAKNAVMAARTGLNVTGQNISNAQTTGYTRQRVDQSAIPPAVLNMLYASGEVKSGQGVNVDSISQLRDPFLDYQYRTQSAATGESSSVLDSLSSLEDIFTVSSTSTDNSSSSASTNALNAELSKLIAQLQGLTSSGSSTTENNVKTAAESLATKFNTIAKQIDTEWNQQETNLEKYGVTDANSLMKSIADLNDQIKSAQVSGASALELQDQRNYAIDQLSQYCSIKVVETPTDVGSGKSVDTLSIYLADDKGNILTYPDSDGNSQPMKLVDGNQYSSFSVSTSDRDAGDSNPYQIVSLSYTDIDGGSHALTDDQVGGKFSGYLQLLNESGSFDSSSTTQGIGYYRQYLDKLAQSFAKVMNDANSTDGGETGALFSAQLSDGTDSDTATITAENIRVSSKWTTNYLTMTKNASNGDDDANDYSNITYMISQLTTSDVTLKNDAGTSIFTGSIQKGVTDIVTTLGQEINSVDSQNSTNEDRLDEIDSERQQISSVDINEEATNLIIYNQALTAASRFMTAVDECLSTIISEMGTAGRG